MKRITVMQKTAMALLLFMCLGIVAFAQNQKKYAVYAVGFYNQENLFDTCHDEGKNDYEYLPAKGWDALNYSSKLKNMARVSSDMGTDMVPKVGCAFIGLSEVENAKVLYELTAELSTPARNYNYVHADGPASRGLD